jgi:5-methylcytosine-specific restriction endonuclease McrA
MSALAQRKVLVLNKSWRAINVITLEEAMKKLTGCYKSGEPKARIIDCLNDFRTMTWEDWAELEPHANYCPECNKVMPDDEIEPIVLEFDGKNTKKGRGCKVCQCPHVGEQSMKAVNAIFRIPTVIQFSRYDKLPTAKIHYNRRTIYRRDNNTCQYCGRRPGTKELSIDHVIPRSKGGKTTWENVVVACTECNAYKADRTPEQAGMKLLRQPKKPKYNLHPGDVIVKDWVKVMGESYWNVQLENDLPDSKN